jgi:transcription initiation factor IIE alpha subunit
MAPRAKCPNCGNVRIDKSTLRKSDFGTQTVWLGDCPKCGKNLNYINNDEAYDLIDEKDKDKIKDLFNKTLNSN